MNNPDHNSPPRWSRKLLHWLIKSDMLEMIEGDIEELFHDRVEGKGRFIAGLYYTWDVVRFFRPFALKKFKVKSQVLMGINKNYLKVAIRGINRDKSNAVLSILSLVVAVACAMIIYATVDYQLSYDSFNEKSDRIYRVSYEETFDSESARKLATVGPPLGPAIKTYYPEVENSVRFRYSPSQIVSYKEKQFYEDKIFYTDPSVFDIFTFPLILGDKSTALNEKNSIVLTNRMRLKYFGDENPVGKSIDVNGEPLQITGVLQKIPGNIHLRFDFLRPFDAFVVPFGYPVTLDDWGWISFHTYVLLKPDVDHKALEAKLPGFARTHFDEDRLNRFRYRLQPLSDIYFGEFLDGDVASGDIRYVIVLSSIGILLLLLSIFNFTNIATAKSLSRSMETGIRKTLGSSLKGLWWRYLMEPIIISMLATIIAFFMVPYGLRYINSALGMPMMLNNELLLKLLVVFIPLSLIIGILAGIYPSFIMSSIRPLTVLKHAQVGSSGKALRNSLVMIQFVITSGLLIGSFIVRSQMNFMLNKDLGYDKDEIALLHMPGEILERYYTPLKNILMSNPNVQGVSMAGGRMDGDTGSGPIRIDGLEEGIPMEINAVGEDFFKLLGVPVIAGREFSVDIPYDSADGVILNINAVKALGWSSPEEALGQHIIVSTQRDGHVMGVVDNFHFRTLHDAIKPLVMIYPHTRLRELYLRIKPGNAYEIVSSIEKDWKNVVSDVPFDFTFLSDHLHSLYQSDLQFAALVKDFSWITIIIATLGLYGLITLICNYRLKEIGIRKVMGASVYSVIYTLSGSFMVLIVIANLITWPLVYLVARNWIETFAYRTHLDPTYFLLGSLITFLIASGTLIIKIRTAARTNPVNTLKYE